MQAKNKTETAREGRRNHTINLCSKPNEALSEPTKGRLTKFLSLCSTTTPTQIYNQDLNLKALKRILAC